MQAFTTHEGLVAPLDRENVDTDLIIPKQFLKSIKRTGFGPNLFDELRYLDHGEPGMDNSRRPLNPDFVLNIANDPRFLSLNLKNAEMQLDLRDATGEVIDRAGDGGVPFYGGRKIVGGSGNNVVVHNLSMERIIGADGTIGDGTKASSWKACSLPQGGANVAEDYRSFMISTPGEPNSP